MLREFFPLPRPIPSPFALRRGREEGERQPRIEVTEREKDFRFYLGILFIFGTAHRLRAQKYSRFFRIKEEKKENDVEREISDLLSVLGNENLSSSADDEFLS